MANINDLRLRLASKSKPAARGCREWQGRRDNHGYGRITVNGEVVLAHRLAWEIQVGKVRDGMCVLHRCDNPACIYPGHLFLGTRGDNNRDRTAKGRTAKGAASGKAKLKEQDVLAIRKDRRLQREIAEEYGVSISLVSSIRSEKIWKNLGSRLER